MRNRQLLNNTKAMLTKHQGWYFPKYQTLQAEEKMYYSLQIIRSGNYEKIIS